MMASCSFSLLLVLSAYFVIATTANLGIGGGAVGGSVLVSDGPTVRKDERTPLVSSEYGEISAVKISDGKNGCYHLHFITMNPGSLFLPVYLHSEMVLYVNSGSGTLSWINVEEDDDKLQQVILQRGVIYRLNPETVFYIQNNVESSSSYDYYEPQKLQIYAIFPDSEFELQKEQQFTGAYTGVHELVLGFDKQALQAALGVPEDVIEKLRRGEQQPLIVQGQPEADTSMWDVGSWGVRAFLGTKNIKNDISSFQNKKKKKKKEYNIFNEDRDVETCFGWSVTVSDKELDVLKDTDFSVFMVNLTKGSMMGPHWNSKTDEVAIVLQGQGMVQVVCPSMPNETGCKNSKFRVEEGDVFVVPRYHPMTQISFNDDSFVFMGFSLKSKNDIPQNLAGKFSILQRLDINVLAKSFNVRNTTIDSVLSAQRETIIFECISCAEQGEMELGQREARGGEATERGEQQMARPGSRVEEEDKPAFGGGGAGEEGEVVIG